MTYDDFIQGVGRNQKDRIKLISFPTSCVPERIPSAFKILFPNIIDLLEEHIDEICDAGQIIALFSFQPATGVIESEIPRQFQRVIDPQQVTYHLCCALDYLTVFPHQLSRITSWQNAETIVVDFTTGDVMDGDYYLSKVFGQRPALGALYGRLNLNLLAKAWHAVCNGAYSGSFFKNTALGAIHR